MVNFWLSFNQPAGNVADSACRDLLDLSLRGDSYRDGQCEGYTAFTFIGGTALGAGQTTAPGYLPQQPMQPQHAEHGKRETAGKHQTQLAAIPGGSALIQTERTLQGRSAVR